MKDFSKRTDRLVPSASMSMAEQAKNKGTKQAIIDLTWGLPDFDTPVHIKQAAKEAVDSGKNGYTSSMGILPLREAISDFHSNRFGILYDPISEILVTPGVKQGLMYMMQLFIDPGDEVILFEPYWLSYREMILFNQGVPRCIKADKNLKPDINALEKVINSKTKAIIINNPINPSGYIFPKEELDIISTLAVKNDLYIFADEIYDRIIFKPFVSMSEFESIRNRLVVANGFSKAYAMTGWRIGYLLGPSIIINKVNIIHQHTATCASSASQYGALAAISGSQSPVEDMCQTYKRRRDFFVDGLKDSQFQLVIPDGTFYAMIDVSGYCDSGGKNSDKFLNKFGIAAIDGLEYGESAKNYIRLSLTKKIEDLKKVIIRLTESK